MSLSKGHLEENTPTPWYIIMKLQNAGKKEKLTICHRIKIIMELHFSITTVSLK